MIYERFEVHEKMKRIETMYVDFCIDHIVELASTPVFIERVIFDHHPDDYDYEEEAEEPLAGRVDYHMIEYKMNRPDAYNASSHMDIGTFNESYMANKGVWPEEKKRSAIKMRSATQRNLTDTKKRAKSPHSR
jgi:hypothetical protein